MAIDARAVLLRVARARIAVDGLAATSMDQIRREAGISNGSLFHYFPTKNHLARALYLEALASYQAVVARAVVDDPPAREGIAALLAAHLEWVLANRLDARVLVDLRPATTIDGATVDWNSVNAESFAALSRWIAACVKRDEMRSFPLDVWMALVFAPAILLTRSWTAEKATVRPAVRSALARAACAAVAVAPGPGDVRETTPTRRSHGGSHARIR